MALTACLRQLEHLVRKLKVENDPLIFTCHTTYPGSVILVEKPEIDGGQSDGFVFRYLVVFSLPCLSVMFLNSVTGQVCRP